MFGDMTIPSKREYCYLGIVFSLSGSLRPATEVLKQKGFRSYFALKSAISLASLKPSTTMKLFDMLVKPAASYGCQIWLPESSAFKADKLTADPTRVLRDIASDPIEKLHISFLKWTMRVNKRTSNAAVWGETGRFPLAVELSKQVFDYVERLKSLDKDGNHSLVRHAFCEQKSLGLSWYSNIINMKSLLESQQDTIQGRETPTYRLRNLFRVCLSKIGSMHG